MRAKLFLLLLLFCCGTFFFPSTAPSLDYPTREVEWIIQFAPGSASDQFSRVVCKFAEKHVGKPLIVVNKPGGGGMLGYSILAAAKPDGYTIGHLGNRTIMGPYLTKGATFTKDSFRPIGRYAYLDHVLFVKKGGPYDLPLKELEKKAKEGTKKITIGSTPQWGGPDVIRAIFEDLAGIQFNPISFPGGGAESVPALLGGHVDLLISNPGDFYALYKGGKFNLIALAGEQRNPLYPQVPTFREFGYDIVLNSEYFVGAPVKVPDAIINYLAEAFGKGCAGQDYKEAIANMGGATDWRGPEGAKKIMESMDQLYRKIIAKYNLKPE